MVAQMHQEGAVETPTPEAVQQPTPAPAAPAPEPTPAPQPSEPKPVDWEHKYSTLKGMYDADVPRLHAQNRELKEQLSALEAKVATLSAPKPEPAPKLVTDQDRESFGPDLVALMERAAKEATAPLLQEIAALKSSNAQLQSQVGSTAQQSTQTLHNQFVSKLEQLVPEVHQMNTDEGFIAWLREVDPVYGIPRQMALNKANQDKDAGRCAAIFNAYKATKAPAADATRNAKNELARQVTPARTRAASEPVAQQPIIWTQESITHFYEQARRGAIPADEVARLEADLHAATVEGRVR
ncbi:hypothetical protein [Paraburkholderia unamae]|uniref:Uncharacterized protein n=1 Tax=Paraburkholderia unamae TaxID=219649 RepID=A0ACC6RHA9_9BURK